MIREAHVRDARKPPRKRRLGVGEPMCHEGDGRVKGGSARETMHKRILSRAKGNWANAARAFEAVRGLNTYNLFNGLYNAYNNVHIVCVCVGLWLFGSDRTGREVTKGHCWPARRRAGQSVRQGRIVVLPNHFGPSDLLSIREEAINLLNPNCILGHVMSRRTGGRNKTGDKGVQQRCRLQHSTAGNIKKMRGVVSFVVPLLSGA